MRKLILNLHIYAGLLCFSYLIIFGISSLNFNHHPAFTTAKSPERSWQQPVSLPDLPRLTPEMSNDQRVVTKAKTNEQIRDALGLFGFQRPWKESYWKDDNNYHASLVRPGKTYEVDVHLDTKTAAVKEIRGNPFDVMRALHGFAGNMPSSMLVSTWAWFTELCVFTVVFAACSGVYLWTRRRNEWRIGFILLGGALATSVGLIAYITVHG